MNVIINTVLDFLAAMIYLLEIAAVGLLFFGVVCGVYRGWEFYAEWRAKTDEQVEDEETTADYENFFEEFCVPGVNNGGEAKYKTLIPTLTPLAKEFYTQRNRRLADDRIFYNTEDL